MTFIEFARSHGILIDELPPRGVWKRYPTEGKPAKRNGAVKFDGDFGHIQNWDAGSGAVTWKPDENVRPITEADRAAAAKKRRERDETQEKGWARAAARAATLLATCRPGNHGYPHRKGFPHLNVLVTPDGEMFVPMRDLNTNALRGGQVIRWLADERRWEKLFLPGMRAKGAILCLGAHGARETVLCEGWATGQSLMVAIDALKISMNVLVCFSSGNLVNVAPQLRTRAFVFADNDASLAGEEAAAKTGLPWTMAPEVGLDANDWHKKHGMRSLAGMLLDLRRKTA